MSTNVSLTPELENFVRERVREGRYNNVSEVVREGLRLLQDTEQARRSAEHARELEAVAVERERARRRDAMAELVQRWTLQPAGKVEPWTRDELYD